MCEQSADDVDAKWNVHAADECLCKVLLEM